MTGSSFCIKFALCLGCLAGGSLAFGQSAANLSAGGLGPPTASLSANLSAGTGMVSSGGGGGGRARLSMNSSGTSDTGVRSGSRALSSARAMKAGSSLISYGPTQTHLGYLHTGMTPSSIHVSSGSGSSTLGGLNHGGGAASGGWGGSSGSNRSTPLYSTMMKVERYGTTRKSMMGPTKPGTKKGAGSALGKLLGQSSGH
jgi:hypothetical protein